MTPQQIDAMKLALEALELCNGAETVEGVVIYTDKEITALEEVLAEHAMREVQRLGQEIEQEPEFFTHSVERPYDWSEWVCPDPKGYMMKCCDCGLVHEAEFSVVRYKSETEREYCDRVDDPNLQAVFRMRRSEQWSPEDTAHRTGGLPMAQPEQEPVAILNHAHGVHTFRNVKLKGLPDGEYLVYTHPPQRKPLTYCEECMRPNPIDGTDCAHGIKENT